MMPAMMCAWFLYQVVSSCSSSSSTKKRLHSPPYVMQSAERNTNRSLWGDKTTPFRWLCTHTRTADSPIQLFTWPLQTFQRSSSGGKWSSRVPYHSQSCISLPMFPSPLTGLRAVCVCVFVCVRVCNVSALKQESVHLDFSFSPEINSGQGTLRHGPWLSNQHEAPTSLNLSNLMSS